MKRTKVLFRFILFGLFCAGLLAGCGSSKQTPDDIFEYTKTRQNDLQLGIYLTADAITEQLNTEYGRREAISIFRLNGITTAYIEVYRGGITVDTDLLKTVRDFFIKNGVKVVGGIATVPGENFGVHQEGKLSWFNWQNNKTQQDLEKIIRSSAKIFDTFIIDDFLCTADTSSESVKAKGEKSWSQYRMDLLSGLSKTLFIDPAKEENPEISMIIKFPQWYDRFQLFGYDVVREPQVFDQVFVGTETRGQFTQRYGFVQPYEGFISFRWMKSLTGEKLKGAWFDHGDCEEYYDFVEQAYQTVLAGAQNIVLFNYFDFILGNQGDYYLRKDFPILADLAKFVQQNPVKGTVGYKPPQSDAGGNLYIMDYIGMLGAPLVPSATYPREADVVFLGTQAAADADIYQKVKQSVADKKTIIMTPGFIANANNSKELAEMAGLKYPVTLEPFKANFIMQKIQVQRIRLGLDMEAKLETTDAKALLNAREAGAKVPFLTHRVIDGANIYVLNAHTFSQIDFDRVNEVLLAPKPLGLIEMPKNWANFVRSVFNDPLNISMDAETRICIQPLGDKGLFVHNYNMRDKTARIKTSHKKSWKNKLTGAEIKTNDGEFEITIPARSRMWLIKN